MVYHNLFLHEFVQVIGSQVSTSKQHEIRGNRRSILSNQQFGAKKNGRPRLWFVYLVLYAWQPRPNLGIIFELTILKLFAKTSIEM
jgi:hypothetical protein